MLKYFLINALKLDCLDGCFNCTNGSRCLQCNSPYFLKYHISNNTDTCESQCDIRYYPDYTLSVCRECDFRCLACTGPSFENCLSCDPMKDGVVQMGSTICQCNSGYTVNELEKRCEKCVDPLCVQCSYNNASVCLKCTHEKIGVILDTTLHKCICQQGMYKNYDYCEECNSLCSECNGPSSTQCLPYKCSDKSYPLDTSITTCLYMCATSADNLYLDPVTKTCRQCKSPCKSCYENPTKCTSCITNYFLYNSNCLALCPSKYYADSGSCLPCSEKCIECEKKTNYCIIGCTKPWIYKDHECVDKCGDGFAPLNYTCYPCEQDCAECYFDNSLGNLITSTKICTKCKYPYYFLDGKCLTKCPSGMYSDEEYICRFCHEACNGCTGGTNRDCIKCNSPLGYMKITEELCDFPSCTAGTFYNRTLLSCIQCAPTCSECDSLTYCKSCVKGYMLDSNKHKCYDPCNKLGYTHKFDSTECIGIFYKISVYRNLRRWEKYESF